MGLAASTFCASPFEQAMLDIAVEERAWTRWRNQRAVVTRIFLVNLTEVLSPLTLAGSNPLRLSLDIQLPSGVNAWIGNDQNIQAVQTNPVSNPGFSRPAGTWTELDRDEAWMPWYIVTDAVGIVSCIESIGAFPYPTPGGGTP